MAGSADACKERARHGIPAFSWLVDQIGGSCAANSVTSDQVTSLEYQGNHHLMTGKENIVSTLGRKHPTADTLGISVSLKRATSDLIEHGPLYALANHRIHSPEPLAPLENWKYWTDSKPGWLEKLMRAYPPRWKRRIGLASMLKQDHASGIAAHYDVSNEFYALFLDKKYRFYTCADFACSHETLEEAQTRKAEFIRCLLKLSGNEKVLDLGCGWGSMLRYIRDKGHSGQLAGLTLSQQQLNYNRQQEGFDVSLCDFIEEPLNGAPYDRIYSIGALEHVRPGELSSLYQKIYQALVPGGLAVHQFFSYKSDPYPISVEMLRLFFPGSLLSTHRLHTDAAEAAGFKIVHDSIHDYKPTIKAWYDRLVANRCEAMELVGLEVCNRYMTFLPIAWLFFKQQEAELHRVVTMKDGF